MKPEEFKQYKPTRYWDWFGDGDSHKDYQEVVDDYGEPNEVWVTYDASREFSVNGNTVMTLLIYDDKIVVIGYDGNEYTHRFEFKRYFDESL